MTSGKDLTEVRREYIAESLHRADLDTDPHSQFSRWLDQACEIDPLDATSMVLATASVDGAPSARIVLLKHFDQNGFCWYTDYLSLKGLQLEQNPQAELLFYWRGLERQVRISGKVEKLTREDAERYFYQRPQDSQLSASASVQSRIIDSREQLEANVQLLANQLEDGHVPCPKNWGGYRLKAARFEFWQGRASRLHDRLIYCQQPDGWDLVRLTP